MRATKQNDARHVLHVLLVLHRRVDQVGIKVARPRRMRATKQNDARPRRAYRRVDQVARWIRHSKDETMSV
jgi:hypothetical protein